MGAFDGKLDWRRLDVTAIVEYGGVATVSGDDLSDTLAWLEREQYEIHTVDGWDGGTFVAELSRLLRWQERFGYEPSSETVSADALWDAFDLEAGEEGAVLLITNADAASRALPRLFDTLLEAACRQTRVQLASGRRFFVLLALDDASDLPGRPFATLSIPYPQGPRRR